jgi:multidrug transporter EmrE-like cation transporter
MLKYVVALVVALVLNAFANLMIRFGMHAVDQELGGAGAFDGGLVGLIRLLIRHWVVLLGLACFAANVVFYAFALQKMPISIAYPVMVTGGFVIIVVVAGIILKERLTPIQWLGVVAILVGVTLVARDAGRQMSANSSNQSAGQLEAEH